MSTLSRTAAVDRLEELVETVERDPMPVPVRELWAFGDVALGLDPIDRLDVYLTKDVLLRDDGAVAGTDDGSRSEPAADPAIPDVEGIGETVRTAWARQYPSAIRTNHAGYVAPERCLAAHLFSSDEPIHLEVCNTSFEDNVTQRLYGAQLREAYHRILDPRGVCLWIDGQRSEEAFRKLRAGELVFPTLPAALEMLGMDDESAEKAARAVTDWRRNREGVSVRGDVV